jgi:gamma-glutamyltranspeptidase/glutathione hydrolase
MKIGAVSSTNKLAADAAFKIMESGGNAFDAAVAAAAVLGVVEPANSGLGGGGLWLLKEVKSSQVIMLDSREESPSQTDAKIFKANNNRATVGCFACAIPGIPAALDYINRNYGSIKLSKCLQKAIDYAEHGFYVDEDYQRLVNARLNVLRQFKDIQDIFLVEKKTPPLGHQIIQRDLAETLKIISKKGRDGFYKGQIAKKMVDCIQQQGGFWILSDLENYRVKVKKPLQLNYHDAEIITANAPSSGGVQLLLMLKIIDLIEYQLKPKTYTDEIHLLLEAMYKSYYYKRQFLDDASDISNHMTDKTLESLVEKINLEIIDRPIKQCHKKIRYSEQTTHLSIIDRYGNCVSATLSLNYQFV